MKESNFIHFDSTALLKKFKLHNHNLDYGYECCYGTGIKILNKSESEIALVKKEFLHYIYNKNKANLKKITCSICLDKTINIVITKCNHEYCSSCINKWRLINNTCPMCRKNI